MEEPTPVKRVLLLLLTALSELIMTSAIADAVIAHLLASPACLLMNAQAAGKAIIYSKVFAKVFAGMD